MTIRLQRITCEKNRVNKYNYIDRDSELVLQGHLKAQTSLINPVIIFNTPIDDLSAYNYMSITAFGRHYFINDIVSITKDLTEVHAHVDVLNSFKTEILANKGIIARNEKISNVFLDDGQFRAYQNMKVKTDVLSNSTGGFSNDNQTLVLAVVS